MATDYSVMNERIVCLIDGRERLWAEVTTEDLRATMHNYAGTPDANFASLEWVRRFGRECGCYNCSRGLTAKKAARTRM